MAMRLFEEPVDSRYVGHQRGKYYPCRGVDERQRCQPSDTGVLYSIVCLLDGCMKGLDYAVIVDAWGYSARVPASVDRHSLT